MGSVKTDWGLAPGSATSGDPFRDAGPVEQMGLPIDLSRDEPTLHARLIDLLESEGALAARGITCALKERDDSCCSACPISQDEDPHAKLAKLCAVGKEQERVLMRLLVTRAASA